MRHATGIAAFAVAFLALGAWFSPITNHSVLFLAAFSPYMTLCASVSAVLLFWARRTVLAILAISLTIAGLAIQLPLYVGPTARIVGNELRVMSANLREGQADPAFIVGLAETHADVVALQELTPQEADRLSAAGMDAKFPYRWLDARDNALGAGIWSRFPLREGRSIGGFGMPLVSVRVASPDTSSDPTVLVVHIPGPWPQRIGPWRDDLNRLPQLLNAVADEAGEGSVLVVGDFNATRDMQPFRALLNSGYRDAAEQARAGIGPTFPTDSWLPPMVAIDHILTRNCTASSLRTLEISGSDHRAVTATVILPRMGML